MAYRIFFISFAISACFLGFLWNSNYVSIDKQMWANQATFVQNGDPQEFDVLRAYGHPGGPVVEGTIAGHVLFHVDTLTAIIWFMTLAMSIVIACASVVCYWLRKDTLWWLLTVVVLSGHRLLLYATPPTALVTVLAVLLLLLTIGLVEHVGEKNTKLFWLWALVAGCTVATRVDTGAVVVTASALLLWYTYSWKKVALLTLGSLISFAIFDPFMWFMPLHHVLDLFAKTRSMYAEFQVLHIAPSLAFSISGFVVVGIVLSCGFIFLRKKINPPFTVPTLYTLTGMTVVWLIILFTAHYQVIRYFTPIISIWEVLIPLFLYALIPEIRFAFFPEPRNQALIQKTLHLFIPIFLLVVWLSIFYFSYLS